MPPVEVTKSVSDKIVHGHTTIGTTAAALSTVSRPLKRGLIIRAPGSNDDATNSEPVYIGGRDSITANTAAATDGFPLVPGASVTLEVNDVANVYAISESGAQDLAWIGL